MDAPHSAVHAAGKEAMTALRSGDLLAGVEAVGRMEEASFAVVESLERLAASGEANPVLLCHPT